MKKRSIAIAVIAVLLIASLLIGCNGNSGGASSGGITLEQFNSIESGMSYDEVAGILGSSGELAHEAGVTRVYHWTNSSSSALVTVIFVDGSVDTTAQVGLG